MINVIIVSIIGIFSGAFGIFSLINYIFKLNNKFLSKWLKFDKNISGEKLGIIAHILETIILPMLLTFIAFSFIF